MSLLTGSDSDGHKFQAIVTGGTSQSVAVSGSSTQSSAFQAATTVVRVYSTTDCFLKFGTNPTAVANTSIFLPAGVIDYLGVPQNQSYKVAVLQSTASGTLYVTEGV